MVQRIINPVMGETDAQDSQEMSRFCYKDGTVFSDIEGMVQHVGLLTRKGDM